MRVILINLNCHLCIGLVIYAFKDLPEGTSTQFGNDLVSKGQVIPLNHLKKLAIVRVIITY
jgi:hypothetical protein